MRNGVIGQRLRSRRPRASTAAQPAESGAGGRTDACIVTKIPNALDLLFCNIEGWPGIHSPSLKNKLPPDVWDYPKP